MRLSIILTICVLGFSVQSLPPVLKVPKSLDSLQWFLKTQPVDTMYTIAMKDCAFRYIIDGQYERADSLRLQLEGLRSKLQYFRIDFFIHFIQATNAYHTGKDQLCLHEFRSALASMEKYRSRYKPESYESALNNVAAAYNRVQKPDSAMHYSLLAIKVQEQYQYTNAGPYTNIGNVLSKFEKFQQALPYYEKALAIQKAKNDLIGMAVSENKLGTLYDNMLDPRKGLTWFKAGLAHAEEAGYQLLQTDLLVNLGLASTALKQYDAAAGYLKRGEKLCRELNNISALKTNLHNQGELFRELKKFDVAEKYYLEAWELSKNFRDNHSSYTAHQALAELYMDTEQYAKACDFLIVASHYKDSIFQAETSDKVQELLLKYEAEKKEKEIQLLNQQNIVQSLQLSIRRRNEVLLSLGIAAVIIGVVIAYRKYRTKNQREMEKVRTSIAADFHDELGANLSSIALYSDLLIQNKISQSPQATPLLENISQNARQTLSAINDLIWTIKPDNDILEGTLLRMKEFSIPLMEARNIAFSFFIQESLRNRELDMTVRKILYLVFKESINNAVKYADATQIDVRLTESTGKIVLQVADNGKGFDVETVRKGNGLKNMRTRAQQMNGELSIDTTPGDGCTIRLSFKVA